MSMVGEIRLVVKGGLKELVKIIFSFNRFFNEREGCYIKELEVHSGEKRLKLDDEYYANKEELLQAFEDFIEVIKDEITILALGPCGRYYNITEIGLFEYLASCVPGVSFTGFMDDEYACLKAEMKEEKLYLSAEGQDDEGNVRYTAIYDPLKKVYIEKKEEFIEDDEFDDEELEDEDY